MSNTGQVVQLVISQIADPDVVSSISAQYHTFMEIDHENSLFLLPPSADLRRIVVSYKRKYICTKCSG